MGGSCAHPSPDREGASLGLRVPTPIVHVRLEVVLPVALDSHIVECVLQIGSPGSVELQGDRQTVLPGSLVMRGSGQTVLPGVLTVKPRRPVETGPFHFAGSLPSGGTASWIRSGRT